MLRGSRGGTRSVLVAQQQSVTGKHIAHMSKVMHPSWYPPRVGQTLTQMEGILLFSSTHPCLFFEFFEFCFGNQKLVWLPSIGMDGSPCVGSCEF